MSPLDAPHQHAAGVIPVCPGGAILLQLRDDRPDVAAPNCWSTIGGHVESGETPAEAAAREMEEETGRRPTTVIPAGFIDHPSGRIPGVTVRSHIFATPAAWRLDELTLGEGQRLDWFTPPEVPALALAPALAPAILGFLDSPIHRALAGDAPPAVPPLMQPLPDDLPAALGIASGRLIAIYGVSAGLARRLADSMPGARFTATPGPTDRPDIILWHPRRVPTPADLESWRSRLSSEATLWTLAENSAEDAAIRTHAPTAGFTTGPPHRLPGGVTAYPLRRRPD